MTYQTNCVNSTAAVICPMVDAAIEVSRRTFLKHVDHESLRELAASMGYADHPSRGLTLAGDWHVTYHRSKFRGRRCYYLRHSAIEYIFC